MKTKNPMKNETLIRQATLNDVNVLSRIHALSWKAAYQGIIPKAYLDQIQQDFWVSSFSEWIKDNIFTIQVIEDKGGAVGCVTYGRSREADRLDWGEIISIYLLPEYFGRGYGQKLLEKALIDLKYGGYQRIFLWVLKANQQARRFYEKVNMVSTEEQYDCEIMGTSLPHLRYTYTF